MLKYKHYDKHNLDNVLSAAVFIQFWYSWYFFGLKKESLKNQLEIFCPPGHSDGQIVTVNKKLQQTKMKGKIYHKNP